MEREFWLFSRRVHSRSCFLRQASSAVHPEREAVEGRRAQDKRNNSKHSADNLESHLSIEFDISTVQALAEKYPQMLSNTKIEIPK